MVTTAIKPTLKQVKMRMFGQNMQMSVCAWLDLADDLKDDSESKARILDLLRREQEPVR
jgi:hypothetical protein